MTTESATVLFIQAIFLAPFVPVAILSVRDLFLGI